MIGMRQEFVPFPIRWLTSGPGPSLLALAASTSTEIVGSSLIRAINSSSIGPALIYRDGIKPDSSTTSCASSVSYTHLTLPTNREV